MTSYQLPVNRERLEKIKSWRETYGAGSNVMLPAEEAEELACMALAAMDSEPVAEVLSSRPGNDTSTIDRALPVGTQLYRHAQPAPVVPDDVLCDFYEVNNWPDLVRELVKHVEQLQDSARRNVKPWEDTFPETLLPAYIDRVKQADDACRASMLQAGNSPEIGIDPASGPDRSVEVRYFAPPGYVLVPKEPTERMIIDGFESEPDETFSEPRVWEKYQKMSGCQQAAYRARLCYAAMISAAPKQENI
ncbi:hypothetical protein RZP54_24985 [Raoultella ornithinolytica]|uniref:hypothetical protein n=1 Tax=Raoultella ornithinolytica TaxID=54291 RepID=UPI002350F3FA|nr:hypothetical protein [Raoultella ornithinolytica]MDC7943724.1 hypothetical protein [Raoultella ornithinolytica]MDV0592208.1 hypothetical protein [Raoultella ornithinolytica]